MSASFLSAAADRTSKTPRFTKARVAVIGCGGWAQGWHLPNLANRKDAQIVAVVDPSDHPGVGGCVPGLCEPMAALSAKYDARWIKSLDELIAAKDELDLHAVICAAPHGAHGVIGKAVLEAGLHLMMEKPMTADVGEARRLYDIVVAHSGQAFLLNNTANWQPGSAAAAAAVSSGKLGEIRHVNCVFAAPLGWLFEGKDHGSWSQKAGSMLGNGFGWGQFSHTFAWVWRVTGLTPKVARTVTRPSPPICVRLRCRRASPPLAGVLQAVFAVSRASETTGADLYDAVTITCAALVA